MMNKVGPRYPLSEASWVRMMRRACQAGGPVTKPARAAIPPLAMITDPTSWRAFSIGREPVTLTAYQRYLSENGSASNPASIRTARGGEFVLVASVKEAQGYCQWLSEQTDRQFTLPTAEELDQVGSGKSNKFQLVVPDVNDRLQVLEGGEDCRHLSIEKRLDILGSIKSLCFRSPEDRVELLEEQRQIVPLRPLIVLSSGLTFISNVEEIIFPLGGWSEVRVFCELSTGGYINSWAWCSPLAENSADRESHDSARVRQRLFAFRVAERIYTCKEAG